MKLEQQVCSLDLAKRLKELGIKQESIVSWQLFHGWGQHEDKWEVRHYSDFRSTPENGDDVCAAFTVAELGEMLPCLTNYRIWEQHSTDGSKLGGKWAITINDVRDDKYDDLTAETEADARAKMLIFLLENGLITG